MITDLLPTFLPRRPKWKLGKIGLCWMREMALQRLGKHQHKENRLRQKGAEMPKRITRIQESSRFFRHTLDESLVLREDTQVRVPYVTALHMQKENASKPHSGRIQNHGSLHCNEQFDRRQKKGCRVLHSTSVTWYYVHAI
jgi:hypothetical protein